MTEQPTFSQRGRIMAIIADHGNGDDIRTLNWLFQNQSNEQHKPMTNLTDIPEAHIWDCLDFTFLETMEQMSSLNEIHSGSHISFINLMLHDKQLTERMAIIGHLLLHKLPQVMPVQMISAILK